MAKDWARATVLVFLNSMWSYHHSIFEGLPTYLLLHFGNYSLVLHKWPLCPLSILMWYFQTCDKAATSMMPSSNIHVC